MLSPILNTFQKVNMPELHPSIRNPTSDVLLDRIDFFFSDPKNTSRVGDFFAKERASFIHFGTTDDPKSLENYALFKRYGELIDDIMGEFCAKESIELQAVADECHAKMNILEGGTSQYLCVSYILAALDFDEFCSIVHYTNDMLSNSSPPMEEESEEESEGDSS
eukprot:Tbor_TRINITY_DN5083_c0_g4::TRINITY_DN5083_c0_g4_i2::g.14242::m.14242